MTNTTTKTMGRSLLLIGIAILMICALAFGVAIWASPSAMAKADGSPYIEFTATVTGDTTRYIDSTAAAPYGAVTVNYKITHNDGINSILLIPEYDSNVFAISSVTVNEESALGTATSSEGDGVKKILLENTGAKFTATDGENETFLTVTYAIAAVVDGTHVYDFGLDVTTTGENNKSVAYYIEHEGDVKGEQNEVEIRVVKANALTLITIQEATIEIGSNNASADKDGYDIVWDYFFTYKKEAVGVTKVDTLTPAADAEGYYVEYTYDGDATPVIAWYEANYEQDGEGLKVVAGTPLEGAPIHAGNYVIGISAPATTLYYAVPEQYAYVHINTLLVEVTIADKASDFGEPLVALTYTANREPFTGDSFVITLSTTATSSSAVGTYPITGEATSVVGSYAFSFTDGTYTINSKAITLTAIDQTAPYSGSEPTVDQSKYTITETTGGAAYALSNATVVITKAAGVNVGTYTLTPSFETAPAGYTITYVNGTFSITSVGADVETIKAYFEGLSKVYNGGEQDLLQVNDLPSYYSYVVTNDENVQVDVDDYVIGITVTADGNHNIDGEQSCYFTVDGSITPAAVTVTAVSVTRIYGEIPVIPSIEVDGTDEELDYTYAIKDGDVAFTPAADTAVGVYDIVLTAGSNPNFTVTYVDGTYTVTKADATVSATANNVYYNRDLAVTSSASVNTLALTPVVTYYTDSACTQAVTPVNAGTYYAKAVIAGTDNYNGAESVASFEILKVKLQGVTFTYNHGNVTWTAVANDIGKTADETGVAAAALKAGTTVTYKVYAGDTLVNTQSACTFDAAAAATYKVVATASDDNYLDSESVMVAAYEVTFNEGDHLGNPTGEVSGMPATQYIFAGQSAVAPAADPAVYSCTFLGWKVGGVAYAFTEAVNGNTTVVADWEAVTYTVTLKYLSTSATAGTDVFTISGLLYNDTVSYDGLGVAPVKASDNPGIYYTFANKWMDENSVEHTVTNSVIDGFTVDGDMIFIAVYDTNYNAFTITYYLANGVSTDANAYQQVGETQSVTYGDPIEYRPLVTSDVAWFKTYGWYSDMGRTAALLTVMPNENIAVYAGYVFDIGTGDVNGDGSVNANDITLYRQWIVGGYDVITVQEGTEWATATGADFDAENHYFLRVVADNNVDESRDIRDVSITRMSVVGGYSWDIVLDTGVTGQAIVRSAPSYTISALVNGLNTYGRARMYQAVTAETEAVSINAAQGLYLDLGGYTLTVKSLSLVTSGKDATITIMNGTIIAEDGITVAAPNGNVVIEEVTAYVDGTPINLQAADSSLHFAGAVEFYDAEIIDGEINDYGEEPAPAVIHVEEGTHVVLEAAATVVIEKIIVTENTFEVPVTPSATATITLDNKTETVVEVQGNTLNEISDVASIVAAAKRGGSYVITADITYNGTVGFASDTTLDLNGHTLRSMNNIALAALNGATLTIVGNGAVMAQEACVMAFDGSTVIINGGSYTSVDNFVLGTNGTAGRGNNTITVNGGTFNGGITSAGYVACGIYAANNDTITVNAGTFNVTNGVGILARSGATTVAEGVTFNVTGDGHLGMVGDSKVTVPAGAVFVIDYAANYPGGDPTLENGTAYAETAIVGTLSELLAARGVAKEIVLTSDVAYSGQLAFGTDTTIRLNGHTLRSTNNIALSALNGATLTVNGEGAVMAQEACVMAFDGSTVIINGGTYTSIDNFVLGTNGTAGRGNNTITVNGGTFNGGITSAGYVACGIYVANSDTVTVNAGTFNVTNGVGILARSGATTIAEGVVFNMLGDNEISGKVGDANQPALQSGLALVLDLVAGYPGGVPTLTNGTDYTVYRVYKESGVTEIETIVKTATALATSSGKVTLGANIAYNGTVGFASDTTLDLNGHTLRSMNNIALAALNGATLTINGNGAVMAQEACVMAFDGSTVIINGGSYTSIDNFVLGTNGTAGRGNNTITVNGGTFNGGITSAGYVACGIYAANNDTITVNAGTFNVTNGVGILARSGATTVNEGVIFNVTGDGHLGKVGDSKVTVPSGAVLVYDLAADYPGGDPALTNNTEYDVTAVVGSVADIDAVRAWVKEIVLGKDIVNPAEDYIIFRADMVLHLNGHSITDNDGVAIFVASGASLTINGNGSVTAQEACVMAFDGSTVIINGGTYTSVDNFVLGTNGTEGRGNNTITVNGGTFNGGITSAGYVACGIYVANSDTVTVNAGTFNVTNGVGILARSGATTVAEGVVFNMLGDNEISGIVGDAKQPALQSGLALVLDLVAGYPGGVPTLTNGTAYEVYTVEAE